MSGIVVFGLGLSLIALAVIGFIAGEIILWRQRRKLAARYASLSPREGS
jgi:hypothetical protein